MIRSPLPALSPTRSRRWNSTDLMMLGTVLIWGINFTVLKIALRGLAPLAFNAVRFSLATTLLLLILRLRGETFRLERRDIWRVLLLGLSGHMLYQVVFINGIALTTPANTSLLMATSPLFVVIYGRALGIERTNRLVWSGIVISFLGILLLITGGGGDLRVERDTLPGDLMILAASMLWAAYTTASKPLLTRYSPVKLTALSMLAGTVPLLALSIPTLQGQDWDAVPGLSWAGLAYSAIFAVVVAYVVWYTSVQRVGNARTAVYANLLPVIAVIVGWLTLGDRLSPLQLGGAAIVLGGLMLTRRGRTR